MNRFIDDYLVEWKNDAIRKPLLIRGARQVGKTHAVRKLGKTFTDFIEINFELRAEVSLLFERDLQPQRILTELSILMEKQITPGKTLLFFDEIQAAPRAFLALRYFYELIPELHVIAAGSLLDFTIEEHGIPVGRVMSLYLYPMSFIEFLYAQKQNLLIKEVLEHNPDTPLSEPIHTKLLAYTGEYLAIGGMPEVVKSWVETKDFLKCSRLLKTLVDTYRQDFAKYAKKFQIKYLDLLFNNAPLMLGRKFKYSEVGDYRKRELEPCLNLLKTAGIIHKVESTAANGIPLGAEADPHDFKLIFLDVALSQIILGLNLGEWIINPLEQFINKGYIVEAFVGQEILAYSEPYGQANLYYWRRTARASEAEIDYVIQQGEYIVPIEVKSGKGNTLKSLHMFLESHPKSLFGIKLSTLNYSVLEKVSSYPLYAIAKVVNFKIKK